jgi:hypothetical protein
MKTMFDTVRFLIDCGGRSWGCNQRTMRIQ